MDQHGEMTAKRWKPFSVLSVWMSLIYAVVQFAGCGGGGGSATPPPVTSNRPAMVSMKVLVTDPSNTTGPVTLRTGMIFGNETDITMTPVSGATGTWEATIWAPEGTILRYTYRLNGEWERQESYVQRPGQFHYRELLVARNAEVNDTVAYWGSVATGPTSTLMGTVTDHLWQPIMGATVSAGPYQVMTRWDGTYSIKGVPAGPCAVTVRTDNGEYQPTMEKVTIPAAGTATKDLMLTPATPVTVTFRVTVPADTPANAVPRLYGDAYRLGMFPFFEGSAIDPSRAIDMTAAGARTWTTSVALGQGSCYQYLYTLGDFRINHERDGIGTGVVRSFCVTGAMTLDDTVVSWKSPGQVPVTLTATSPTVTDTVYVTTDGWGGYEPLRMWKQGPGQWQYVLYTDPGIALNYRYIRNGDPAIGLETVGTDTNPPAYRTLVPLSAVSSNDTITAWRHGLRETVVSALKSTGTTTARKSGEPFQTGVELIDYWRPAWKPLIVPAVQRIMEKNAQWVQIPSVWGLVSADPPMIERGWNSFTTEELVDHIRAAKAQGLKVALRPFAFAVSAAEEIAFTVSHSEAWYDQFFDQVKAMVRYHARIAEQEGVEMMILGNYNWLDDSDPTKTSYISGKWHDIIGPLRSAYSGKITTDYHVERPNYAWYYELDYLGDKWWVQLTSSSTATIGELYTAAKAELATKYQPLVTKYSKSIVFSEIAYYSADSSAQQTYDVYSPKIGDFIPEDPSVASDWDEQAMAYEAVLRAFAETPWVQGCYSFGYAYFDFDSKGYSVRGKTAEEIMSQIYQQINTGP